MKKMTFCVKKITFLRFLKTEISKNCIKKTKAYIKKVNVILVKLSYIDLVLKFHDNRLKNGKALAFSDVKK